MFCHRRSGTDQSDHVNNWNKIEKGILTTLTEVGSNLIVSRQLTPIRGDCLVLIVTSRCHGALVTPCFLEERRWNKSRGEVG